MFTQRELEILAEMLCGRVDALKDIASSPNLPANNKRAINNDLLDLQSLDIKLRPYFKGE